MTYNRNALSINEENENNHADVLAWFESHFTLAQNKRQIGQYTVSDNADVLVINPDYNPRYYAGKNSLPDMRVRLYNRAIHGDYEFGIVKYKRHLFIVYREITGSPVFTFLSPDREAGLMLAIAFSAMVDHGLLASKIEVIAMKPIEKLSNAERSRRENNTRILKELEAIDHNRVIPGTVQYWKMMSEIRNQRL